MSDDLHTRLKTVIEERLALAKRLHDAAPGSWTVESGKYFWLLDGDGDRLAEVGHVTDAEFIAAHDPADAIRRHEAALRVQERHAPFTALRGLPACGNCSDGDLSSEIEPWPCAEITDLADAYGVTP